MSNIPDDLRYTGTHVWVQELEDGSVRVGITDIAQLRLGAIVYIELPEVGDSYLEDVECAVVESAQNASDIYCPISGEIVEINAALEAKPATINHDPYGEGWLFRMAPDDLADVEELLDADDYTVASASEA